MSELIAQMEGTFVVRHSMHTPSEIRKAKKAITIGFENQIQERGFSMVELLSNCPTNWNMTPAESLTWIETRMLPIFPLGEFKDEEIGSPLVRNPTFVVALNNPSVEKYEPLIAAGGSLIYNASLVSHQISRADIRSIPIPGSAAATDMDNVKLLNIVMLGALLQESHVLPVEVVERALTLQMPERHRALLELNKQALRGGAALVRGDGQHINRFLLRRTFIREGKCPP